jgi:hypothetical protein
MSFQTMLFERLFVELVATLRTIVQRPAIGIARSRVDRQCAAAWADVEVCRMPLPVTCF